MTEYDAAVRIVRRLTEAGHKAYLAGGCVRDRLLGREPKDFDVATDAMPEVVRRCFSASRFVGESFGVVLVPVRDDHHRHLIEVATFRVESGSSDGRHPDHVAYSDAEHDAARRDFTINGLFEDPLEAGGRERIIDHVGGLADLEQGVIRAIGNADTRFNEDYLRLLRAVRFAARFKFAIEPSTARAIERYADRLGQISRPRIGQEVMAMLTPGPDANPNGAAQLIQDSHLDGPVLTESHATATLATLRTLSADATYPTVLAAWLIDRHSGGNSQAIDATTQRWREALCLSNEHHDQLKEVLRAAEVARSWPAITMAQRKRLLARPIWPQAAALIRASAAVGRDAAIIEQVVREARVLIEQGVATEPLINGDDLIAMGFRPGPKLGELLDAVYDEQLEGRVRHRAEAMDWVRQSTQEGCGPPDDD